MCNPRGGALVLVLALAGCKEDPRQDEASDASTGHSTTSSSTEGGVVTTTGTSDMQASGTNATSGDPETSSTESSSRTGATVHAAESSESGTGESSEVTGAEMNGAEVTGAETTGSLGDWTESGDLPLYDCDRSQVLCLAFAPECAAGRVPSVQNACWGDCVDESRCLP